MSAYRQMQVTENCGLKTISPFVCPLRWGLDQLRGELLYNNATVPFHFWLKTLFDINVCKYVDVRMEAVNLIMIIKIELVAAGFSME